MAVIVTASHKGGVGKTTISLYLAEELASRGYRVAIIEADGAGHNAKYQAARERKNLPLNFKLFTDTSENTLSRTIKDVDAEHQVVIVDLPGDNGLLQTRAVARANLVLIPVMMDVKDVNMAIKGLDLIEVEEEHVGRPIEHRIVLNGVTNAKHAGGAIGMDRSERFLREAIKSNGYPRLESELTWRRAGYRESYTFAETLRETVASSKTRGHEKALHEIEQMADEVIAILERPTEAVA